MRPTAKPVTARRSIAFKRARAAVLALIVTAGAAYAWPRPALDDQARGNAQALRYLIERYAQDHQGQPCRDLGTLVAAAEAAGYNVRVRNPYSGVFAPFDDPAIARPLALRQGDKSEAGVVFYQARPDALGRTAWLIQVAAGEGHLLPVHASTAQLARR